MAAAPLHWLYWETHETSGRPSSLHIIPAEGRYANDPPWLVNADILPFAMGNYTVVSHIPLPEDEGRQTAFAMVENVDGWTYWKEVN